MATFVIPNAPNVNTLETFVSTVNRYGAGLASASQYMVVINPPAGPIFGASTGGILQTTRQQLSFLCEQAEMPGKSLVVNDARYYGPNFKYPTQTEYTDISMTFLVRDEMYEKQFFDNWMMTINPTHTYDFRYKKDYCADINVIQYSMIREAENKSHPTYMVTLRKAFPIAIAPMSLAWGEEGFHRLQVTFAYTEFTRSDDQVRTGFSYVNTGTGAGSIESSGWTLGGTPSNPVPITQTYDGKSIR